MISAALPYMYLPHDANGLQINSVEEGLVGTFLCLGAALGASVGGKLSDKYGRRHNITLLAAVFFFGALGCTFSPNIWVLYFFRIVLGFAVGGARRRSRSSSVRRPPSASAERSWPWTR